MAALSDERCLLARRDDVEALEGLIERIDPLGVNVHLLELIGCDHCDIPSYNSATAQRWNAEPPLPKPLQ
jgi:hypothetical protein